jgi:tellurite resistance protein
MSETIVAAVILIAVAAGAFTLSVRIGMLLGLRLDRSMEASYKAEQEARSGGEGGSVDTGPSSGEGEAR